MTGHVDCYATRSLGTRSMFALSSSSDDRAPARVRLHVAGRPRMLGPGDVVAGKYRVDRVAGAGGMGTVLLATDVQLRRQVAIKVMSPALAGDDHAVRRFMREARAAVRLRSEHVVQVLEVGELPSGLPFIVMEYLEGRDLESVLATRGRLPVRESVDLVLQAIEGIAEAHAAGIVHRDLKPANLFLTRRRDCTHLVKVLDFGLAKDAPLKGESALTSASAVMGTHHYMSPEQLRGSRDVDVRTDIWALGVSLYQLVTGRMPFEPSRAKARVLGAAIAALSELITTRDPQPPHSVTSDVPFGLSSIILRCLEKKPENRYPDVGALARALEAYASPEYLGVGARVECVLDGETLISHPIDVRTLLDEERTTERDERMKPTRRRDLPAWAVLYLLVRDARKRLGRVVTDCVTTLLEARVSTFDSVLHRGRRREIFGVLVVLFLVATILPVLAIIAHARTPAQKPAEEQAPPVEAQPTATMTAPVEEDRVPPEMPSSMAPVAPSSDVPRAVAPPAKPTAPRAVVPTPVPMNHYEPQLGALTVVCIPKCDQIVDNGAPLGPGHVFNRRVPAGAHTLSLSAPNGVRKNVTVAVQAGETRELRVAMDR